MLHGADYDVIQKHPKGSQVVKGTRKRVDVDFEIHGDVVGFQVGFYDPRYLLIIDPTVSFSSYLGGSGWDAAYAITSDSTGDMIVIGETNSSTFPFAPTRTRLTRDVFITKIRNGQVIFTTVLASSGDDIGRAIAVDLSNNIYVAGTATAGDFPTTVGAAQTRFAWAEDAFVAKLDPAGRLVYATFVGASGSDVAYGLAVDGVGNAYVAGGTTSVDFPTTAGAPQRSYAGGYSDSFVLKLNASGSSIIYSTLLGGRGNDFAAGIRVDAGGNAVVAGFTDSTNLAARNALQSQAGGNGDAFVGSLNSLGNTWNYVSYLGGSGADQANAIALDASGNAYITGTTSSSNFPTTTGSLQPLSNGSYDVFVVKISPGGARVYSTLYGGADSDSGTAIAVNSLGQAWVAGFTLSFDLAVINHPPVPKSGQLRWFHRGVSERWGGTDFFHLLGRDIG